MNRLHPALAPALLLVAALWLPKTASAATNCIASATPLAFGTVTGANNVDATGTVTVNCNSFGLSLLATARIRMCLRIGAGVDGGSQTNPRRMINAFGDAMQFQIYQDASRFLPWGDGAGPITPDPVQLDLQYSVPALGGNGSVQATMYGRVPFQSGLAAGGYGNPFNGITHARVDYRYAEAALGTPNYPASCISGGDGGGAISFNFTASATVPNNCVISAATSLDFGTVPGLIDANRDQTSTITFTCTGRTAWNVGLDDGQNANGGIRRMRLGATGSHVSYELYRDPGRTQRWGTTIEADTVPGTGTGSEQVLTVYGRVPAAQAVPAGDYGDVIMVTVSY